MECQVAILIGALLARVALAFVDFVEMGECDLGMPLSIPGFWVRYSKGILTFMLRGILCTLFPSYLAA